MSAIPVPLSSGESSRGSKSRAGHSINRRRFLKRAAAGAATMAFPFVLHAAARRERPNVLFISVDDMNTDPDFCGGTVARAPCLSRLASRGMVFTRNYCQYPLCSPSRSSLMTGLRPDTTRVFDNEYRFRSGLPDVVTLPQMFMRNGYFAARVGKIYHYDNPEGIGTSGLDDPASWQQVANPAGRDRNVILEDAVNYTPRRHWGSAIALLADKTGRDEDYTDGMVATEALALMEQHRREPFFLGVGFYKPHCPYIVPQKYVDLYPPERIVIPPVSAGYPGLVPEGALESTNPWPVFGVTLEQALMAKRAYYAAISFVDAQIGRVLDGLDRLGLAENTIVVFWSDHGYHLGDHGLWFKKSCFEHAARVPLIIAAPGVFSAGHACARIAEHVDIYPTLADLAGIEPPPGLAGVSLRPLLENPKRSWERPAHTQVERKGFAGWSVRTERWRYTQWDEGRQGEELYDHDSDPHEMRNLASDPDHAKVVADMKVLVKKNWPARVTGGRGPDAGRKAKRE